MFVFENISILSEVLSFDINKIKVFILKTILKYFEMFRYFQIVFQILWVWISIYDVRLL